MFVRTLALAAFSLSLNAAIAAEDPVQQATATPEIADSAFAFGVRIGGYGFKETSGGRFDWEDCRMDGVGVFMTGDLFTETFFGEVSSDVYTATEDAVAGGMDRTSVHVQTALGARMFPNALVTPFVQIGGGAEWTRFSVNGGADQTDVLPSGFIGTGGEIKVGDHLRLGATLRMYLMGLPTHDHGTEALALTAEELAHGHPADQETIELQTASQVQFFVRYAL